MAKKLCYIFIAIVYYSLVSAYENQIVIYGEEHNSCFSMRKRLAQEANKKEIYLFSENVYYKDSMNQIDHGEINKKNKKFLGYKRKKNIWGLEDYFAKNTAVALGYLQSGDEIYKNYQANKNEKDLVSVNNLVGIGINQIDTLPFYLHRDSVLSEYFSYPFYLQKTIADQEFYIQEKVLPFSRKIQNILMEEIKQFSANYQVKEPFEINKDELKYIENFYFKYSKYSGNLKGLSELSVILWRNYLMVQRLAEIINSGKLGKKPIAVVLGAAHVLHFEYLIKNVFRDDFINFKVDTNFACWEKFYSNI